tara:strand:- start:79 stop:282 length:204 start_codon:yes stop_codon:yes gene_type:complete
MSDMPERLNILKIIENNDGTTTLNFEITEEFQEWFLKEYSLDAFCNEKFSEFIREKISNSTKGKEEL